MTVWRWNRAISAAGGHLRIEMQALPAGPTMIDTGHQIARRYSAAPSGANTMIDPACQASDCQTSVPTDPPGTSARTAEAVQDASW